MISLGKCNMISLNARGLTNLQETYSEPNDENMWKS